MIRTHSFAAVLSAFLGCSLYLAPLPTETASGDDNQSVDAPDLVISALSANLVGEGRVSYSFTITNVGNEPANLDGRTDSNPDNVSVQAFISKDTLFQNEGDLPAGGTILGRSPLGQLKPGDSRKGSFSASIRGGVCEFPYLILMIDWGKSLDESNEDNNLAIVGIGQAGDNATSADDSTMESIYKSLKSWRINKAAAGAGASVGGEDG